MQCGYQHMWVVRDLVSESLQGTGINLTWIRDMECWNWNGEAVLEVPDSMSIHSHSSMVRLHIKG